MDNLNPTPEEMQELIEKAKRDLEETLSKMTPEEREQAELRAQKAIADDKARMDKLIAEASALAAQDTPKPAPKFCGNCGAPANGGKFCQYCGSPL